MSSNVVADVKALADKAMALRPNPQLEMWPEEFRALPNESARSALFTIRRGKRKHFEGESVLVLGDGELKYTGQELRTEDEDVWLQIMHLARLQPLGECVEFSPYSVLKALGWQTNGTYYKRLRVHLTRMQATTLEVKSKRLNKTLNLSLISKAIFVDEGNKPLERWMVWIEPEMRAFFGSHSYTQLQWERRKTFTPLAKRLMDLFASHKEPFPVKTATLRDMCASECASLTKWRQLVRGALQELVTMGFLTSWKVDSHDRVAVKRS